MRDDRLRLLDSLDAISEIEAYSTRGRNVFEEDPLVRTWILYHLQIVGEACRGLSEPLRSAHPEIPWSEATSLRNVLVHQYFGIDLEAAWALVEQDLPGLKQAVSKILSEKPPS
jgi:uncharacterized protein with HEPN domain